MEYRIPKNKGERSEIFLHAGKEQLIPIMIKSHLHLSAE